MDIVGFEHEAKTRKDKATVEKAKQKLTTPLSLFKLPASAGCRVTEAKVEVEIGEHDHDHDAKESQGRRRAQRSAKKNTSTPNSMTNIRWSAQSPANITAIEFGYFSAFAGAEKLDVNVITPKGQNKFEVTRAKPRLNLAGMI